MVEQMNMHSYQSFKKIAIIITSLHILLNISWLLIFKHNDWFLKVGSNIFSTTGPLIATIWLYQKYKKENVSFRKFWLFPCLANICYILAMFCYMYYDLYLNIEPPFPGVADIFWMLMIVFYLIMFSYFTLLNGKSSRMIQFIFDTLIVMVVATTISWEFLIKDILSHSQDFGLLYKIVYVGYPIGDLGILFGLLAVFNLSNLKISSKAFSLMFIGMLSFLIGDSFYLYLVSNELYYTGHLVDSVWPSGMLLFALSAFNHTAEKGNLYESNLSEIKHIRVRHLLSFRLWLPYISVIALTIIMFNKGTEFNSFVLGLLISVLLIILRQILTLIENEILLEKSVIVNKDLEKQVQQRTQELYQRNQQLKDTIKEVQYLAYHDTLTGLPNRRYFEIQLDEILHQTNHEKKVAVLFLDLDRFKLINDTLSHSIGDILLKLVAKRLKDSIEEDGIICRQGGDEFLILLRNTSHIKASAVAKKIIESLSNVYKIEGHEIFITCSVGISIYPDHGKDLDYLIKRADAAMYLVKDNGKNSHQVFTHDLDEMITRRLNLENGLRTAVERKELLLYFQPKVDLKTKGIVGMEALLRWQHPEIGFISPTTFISIAEETGVINQIGAWVIEEACRLNKEMQMEGLQPLCVSVNVSALQFLQPDFYDQVKQTLTLTQLDPQYLEIEITESIMQNSQNVSTVLLKLRKLGIRVSLDDFGSGFSSLNQIKHIPLDILKIDKAFIDDIVINPKDQAIVTTVLALGKSLGLTVLAEGVETEEQLAYLKENGCDQIQGFIIAPPLSFDAFKEKLKKELIHM